MHLPAIQTHTNTRAPERHTPVEHIGESDHVADRVQVRGVGLAVKLLGEPEDFGHSVGGGCRMGAMGKESSIENSIEPIVWTKKTRRYEEVRGRINKKCDTKFPQTKTWLQENKRTGVGD